jgi:uncharacterized membrane protein
MIETHSRTVAKAVSYRLMAIVSSVIMIGWESAVYVEISKTFVFYVCERVWLKSSWGMRDGIETMMRSITKSIVYRAVATVAVAYWVGWVSALWLALVQTMIFIANDRAWQLIKWGRTGSDGMDSNAPCKLSN